MQSRQRIILLVVALLLVAIAAIVYFAIVKPDSSNQGQPRSTTTKTRTTAPPSPNKLKVANGVPAQPEQQIKVTQGDRVQIEVDSDSPVEIHLHGYDIEKMADSTEPAHFNFIAKLTGIFDIELHPGDQKLAELVVNP